MWFKKHNEWAEGYGWMSDKLHRGEAIDLVIADLKKSENYKKGVRAAVQAELLVERMRQATLELNRVEVAELKKQLAVKEKSRAEWYKMAAIRRELLESIKEQIEEEL